MSEIPEEITKAAEKAFKYGFGLRYEVAIEAIALAILAERERCANIAETATVKVSMHWDPDGEQVQRPIEHRNSIASAIRKTAAGQGA